MNLDIKKKKLIQNIEKLSKLELKEIFILLKNKNIEYSINKNGIFINLKNFDEELITELQNYVIFCKKNKIFLENNIKNNNNLIKNYNKNNIDLIHNFVEYTNLKNLYVIEKISINLKKKKKKENHMKFINIIKKYNRILLNSTDNELNLNELSYEKYKCN
tara:strand:- start:2610 stop:3092 length:483 start_codon:yes stop_codon:yes gene_type:complete